MLVSLNLEHSRRLTVAEVVFLVALPNLQRVNLNHLIELQGPGELNDQVHYWSNFTDGSLQLSFQSNFLTVPFTLTYPPPDIPFEVTPCPICHYKIRGQTAHGVVYRVCDKVSCQF